jgi:hypothetical protein
MHTTPDNSPLRQATHDSYHAPPEADIHAAVNGPVRTPANDVGLKFLFRDHQPGTADFAAKHLVGSAAPEPIIERMDAIGPEDFGPVELLDGRSGQPIARVNRHMRRRLEER